jgi:hypothetical protein
MRAINAAYHVLSNPAQRAAYDARRYLPRQHTPTVSYSAPSSRPRPVVVASNANPPTQLQRHVDRIVAVLGVVLLVAIGFYTINVIPYAERQFQIDRQYRPVTTTAPTNGDHPTGLIPERLRSDDALRSFPGTVLIAPSSLEPFASLPVLRIDANGMGIARYAVYYGDLTTGGASIAGLVGRASFDSGAPRLPDCSADALYCAGPVPGQPAGTTPPGLELFRAPGLVDDNPAFATHRVCCNGVFWLLSWYEPRANMSYTIDVSRSVAARYGTPSAAGDESAARAFAALAPKLVRLP